MEKRLESVLKRIEKFDEEVPTARISRSNGEFLRFLVLATKSKKVLELGSSVGYSTIWLASALKETKGHIYTVETSQDRAELAKINFQDSGLGKNIILIEKDALEVMSSWKNGKLDIVFIDAMKRDYLKYYLAAMPLLKKGGIIIADDVIKLKDKMKDFLSYVNNDKSVYALTLDLDDGIMLIYKK